MKSGILHFIEENYGYSAGPDGWESDPEIAIIPITGVIMPGLSQSPGLLGGGFSADPKRSSVKSTKLQMMMPSKRSFLESTHREEVLLPPIKSGEPSRKQNQKTRRGQHGGVAASGGYYVSAAADAIFAEETTITGSIGVYSGKFNAHTLLQYLKINVESEDRRTPRQSLLHLRRNESQRAKMEEQVELTYQQFKTVVSDGREMEMDKVEEVARGRASAGTAAKEVGLVDETGGIYDAISYAAKEVGLNGASVLACPVRTI